MRRGSFLVLLAGAQVERAARLPSAFANTSGTLCVGKRSTRQSERRNPNPRVVRALWGKGLEARAATRPVPRALLHQAQAVPGGVCQHAGEDSRRSVLVCRRGSPVEVLGVPPPQGARWREHDLTVTVLCGLLAFRFAPPTHAPHGPRPCLPHSPFAPPHLSTALVAPPCRGL